MRHRASSARMLAGSRRDRARAMRRGVEGRRRGERRRRQREGIGEGRCGVRVSGGRGQIRDAVALCSAVPAQAAEEERGLDVELGWDPVGE
eukprot:3442437-Rhodomonas_salina.1